MRKACNGVAERNLNDRPSAKHLGRDDVLRAPEAKPDLGSRQKALSGGNALVALPKRHLGDLVVLVEGDHGVGAVGQVAHHGEGDAIVVLDEAVHLGGRHA